jgi:chemotaxis protein methyltransferase CheR
MKPEDFEVFEKLLKEISGLVISQDKVYLLESRLRPLIEKNGLNDMSDLAAKVRMDKQGEVAWSVVEAMTTNETSFFRDTRPFDIFKETVIPEVMKNKGADKKIRIWSAACSSGQEPYSLAMIIKESGWEVQGWNFEITATDISNDILDLAKQGHYSQFEVQRGLPVTMLVKYFTQVEEKWHIGDMIKDMITFKHFNLLHSMMLLGKFDIIFCRNVLIYFDQETKKEVLENMHKIANPNSFLVLGGAETVMGITESFKPVAGQRGLYVPGEV